MGTTYTLSIAGGLAKYMPTYEREHSTIESAKREYARVIESLDTTVQGAHLGMIYGSDGSEHSAGSN